MSTDRSPAGSVEAVEAVTAAGSTVVTAGETPGTAVFDLDAAWRLHPQVAVRPERFGALLYHFGTRRLSFLKSPVLLDVVRGLDDAPSGRVACERAGVASEQLSRYGHALHTLADSQMICERT